MSLYQLVILFSCLTLLLIVLSNLFWSRLLLKIVKERTEKNASTMQRADELQSEGKRLLQQYDRAIAAGKKRLVSDDSVREFENSNNDFGDSFWVAHLKNKIFTNDLLVVGEGAKINAEIEADTAIVRGEVNGAVRAKRKIEIHKTGILRGAVITPILNVAEGAIFEGKTQMGDTPPINRTI